MSKTFQKVVKQNVSRDNRHSAIETLSRSNERTALSVIVQTDGLRGEFRRHALDQLAGCNGTDQLEELATDTTLPRSLRRQAEMLA